VNHQDPSSSASAAVSLKAEVSAFGPEDCRPGRGCGGRSGPPQLTDQLKRRGRERAGLRARLRALSQRRPLSADDLRSAIDDLGGITTVLTAADAAVRHQVYESLGLRLEYHPAKSRVIATATEACVINRVRRGT